MAAPRLPGRGGGIPGRDAGRPRDGRRAGIYLFECTDVTVRRCTVRHYDGDGISFQRCRGVEAADCLVEENGNVGLHPGSDSRDCVIRDCLVRRNGYVGLFVCVGVRGTRFENNRILDNAGCGISIGTADTENLFRGNEVTGNAETGLLFRRDTDRPADGAHRNVFEGNRFRDNLGPRPAKSNSRPESAGRAAVVIEGIHQGLVFRGDTFAFSRPHDGPAILHDAASPPTVENPRLENVGQVAATGERCHRLHEGLTVFVHVPDGRGFTVGLDVRDLNLQANGPRDVLFKVYDPAGRPVVREVIPDDGCTTANMPDRSGGWDHELQCLMNHFVKGTMPTIRWSAWSDPARLATIVPRRFDRRIAGGGPGLYRIVLAGGPDHYVTLRLDPALATAVAGHPTFIHGHGDLLRKAWVYVPPGTTGLFVALTEPDEPRSRRVTITGPDGRVLFAGTATGGYDASHGARAKTGLPLEPGRYDGKLLAVEVSPGPNDYLLKITLQRQQPYADSSGMGALAVFASDPAAAAAIRGGTIEADGQVFFHPFQVRLHEWLARNPLDGDAAQRALRAEIEPLAASLRMLETSDGRGMPSWTNWAYSMGYYGGRIFKPGWKLLGRDDVPEELRRIVREGLIMAGDRLAFATHIEKVNGNAFAQIPVALWYCHRATGDPLQKQLFETFWERWTTEGWGVGSGLSRSGDCQEHFAHDMHYGSYLLDNWLASGNEWVKEGGILGDATDDPRFQKVVDRYRELYSYLACNDADGKPVPANPWSSRTSHAAHRGDANWKIGPHLPKAAPGPDFTVSVNGGDEWFAARRKGYYALTFHGRIAPEWMCQCFEGQLGFGGGAICQLTVPGRGPVLASTLNGFYGKGMHPSQWPGFHLHTLVAERWDGAPVISGISAHGDARLEGTTVTSSGEIRGAHVRVARSFSFGPEAIECTVRLAASDYARVMSIWAHERSWSEVRSAGEMIPFLPLAADGRTPTAVTTAEGGPLTAEGTKTRRVRIDRGGFGVEIETPAPSSFRLGRNDTVVLELLPAGSAPVPAEKIAATYRLVPFSR